MPWINRIIAVLLIAATIPLWQQAGAFPGTATTFPRVILGALLVLAVLLLARSFVPAQVQRGEIAGRAGAGALLRPVAVFAATLGAIFLTQHIGFFPAMLVLAAAIYGLLGVHRPGLYALAIALLLSLVYLVFVVLLDVPLTREGLWQL